MQGLLLAGRYRLADSIGSGGMGRVWRAHDELLHRAVAIKELTAALYVSDSDQQVLLARTRAEARAAARINHSAVVTVHDVLEHDGRPWIVMELVEGHSLADAVKENGRLEPTEAARIGMWVLRALRAAHTAGVLHRDVKPGNVLLSHDGRVLLTDFGIAQIEGDTTITRTGEVVGSVDYLAPERVRGHDPGPSSDLWALGATLYTAVEGRSPFRRTSPLSTMQAVVEEEAAEPQYAGPLAPVIAALLRKDPATRPDAHAAEQMLAEAAEGRRPSEAQAYVPTQHGGPRYDPRTGNGYDRQGGTGYDQHGGPGYDRHTGPRHDTAAGYVTEAATPHRPATGPTAVGATNLPARPPRRRRRLRTVALVVALAAIVGAGTAVVLQQWGHGRGKDAPPAVTSPSPTPTDTTGDQGPVPDNWQRVSDPRGFGLALPNGWKRKLFSDKDGLTQIDYSPDGGDHFLRVAIDTDPDFNDPYQHQRSLDVQLHRLVDYRQEKLEVVTYRDHRASLWEYSYTALAKDTPFPGPRRAVDEAYIGDDGTEYALLLSGPTEDWDTTQQQFKVILRSWQENATP
ncbi:serine/threonine protein kinase [Streptomyces sp. Ru71]|uniref:serine/threonine-protein kinase n=1 Tax=Streptomyces sp. Ru71 TaxID=2080746 RepID=UPI000CDD1C90|nr:serine/threonine-protein kinase [Streptomyces sp. Ru71]POX55478.1 serine/threonine protein kinase [Streptomyces sp. Ru71]